MVSYNEKKRTKIVKRMNGKRYDERKLRYKLFFNFFRKILILIGKVNIKF